MAEHDQLGADAFLQKYGFGEARDYLVVRNGRSYASKALIGAARSFVGDGRGPLKPKDFSGGRNTVVKRLRSLGFEIPNAPRNDVWQWDELLLALDLYFRAKNLTAREVESQCEDLSSILNRMGDLSGAVKTDTYRNRNGVRLKLMNFRRLDPELQKLGRVGMSRGGKGEEAVWQKYASDRQDLHREAQRIISALELAAKAGESGGDDDDPYESEEGGVQLRTHRYYERDRRLISRKKAEAAKRGPLACEACGFDFEARYGPLGSGFIEVHHTKPVHLMKFGEKTRLADLVLLCSNCHRIAHRQRPPLATEEISAILIRS